LRIISRFNDDDDEYFPPFQPAARSLERLAAIGITRWFWPKFVPIARRLRSVTMPTLGVISPASVEPRSRPFRAINVAVGVQL
jgi:hypothetical protein